MTEDLLAAILAKPVTKKPWDDAAKWLKANSHPDAARRVKLWAAARNELRAALTWDRPATLEQCEAAANALPGERCRRLFAGLFDWLDERFPWPSLSFPTWQDPWTTPRVRLVQTLHALGAVDAALFDAANSAADYAYGAGQSESECAADDDAESLARQVRSQQGNAVASSASALQFQMYVMLREQGDGIDEAEIGGRMVRWAVDGAGHAATVPVWERAITAAAAAGQVDTRGGQYETPAYLWAQANGVPERADAASAEARAVASAGLHSLATWVGWRELAAGMV